MYIQHANQALFGSHLCNADTLHIDTVSFTFSSEFKSRLKKIPLHPHKLLTEQINTSPSQHILPTNCTVCTAFTESFIFDWLLRHYRCKETLRNPSSFECSHKISLAPIWTADGFNWLRCVRDDGFFHFMYEHTVG